MSHAKVRYILAWISMVFKAIVNATIREVVYKRYFNELQAHQVSTATGVVLFGLYIWMLARLMSLESAGQAIFIGIIWLGLTVTFEFIFGHYVMKNSWSSLLDDYNIFAGRVWIIVLIWIAIAPFVFYHFAS